MSLETTVMQEFSFIKSIIGIFLAIIIPQLIKTIYETRKNKKFKISYFFLDSGMPSSHSALISAMLTAIFVYTGFSIIFFVSLVFGFITIRDSFGERLETGKHKLILEKIAKKEAKQYDLKREGHTIKQVIAGIVTGIIIMLIVLFI